MLDFAESFGQPIAHFLGIIIERPVAAFVGNTPILIDDIKPLGPGCVGVVRSIGHLVDAERHGEFEPPCEIIGDGEALFDCLGLRIADVVLFLRVRLHLPFIGRMSLANIYGQKVDMVLVVTVEFLDVANLATEGWSSKAAEYQHQRTPRSLLSDMK